MKYFEKWQGIGNDFVVLDIEVEEYSRVKLSKVAKRLCDRRFGIGGDGLICMGLSSQADFRMTIINSDDSSANMYGNALRCAVAQAFKSGRVTKTTMTVGP